MKVIKPCFEIMDDIDGMAILRKLERIGRVCYKSEDKITDDSAAEFVKMLIKRGHMAILEHVSITVKFITDRGVSHEIVRHRLASYAQESTRYCNYSKDKFDNGIGVIKTPFFEPGSEKELTWKMAINYAETAYLKLIDLGASPQEARSVLPSSLKTEIVVTTNLREWRHILKLRTAQDAHPQIREIMQPLLDEFRRAIPVVFDDID